MEHHWVAMFWTDTSLLDCVPGFNPGQELRNPFCMFRVVICGYGYLRGVPLYGSCRTFEKVSLMSFYVRFYVGDIFSILDEQRVNGLRAYLDTFFARHDSRGNACGCQKRLSDLAGECKWQYFDVANPIEGQVQAVDELL